MPRIVALICLAQIFIWTSCKRESPPKLKEHSIQLKNKIGQLNISLFPEFDTLYQYEAGNDVECGSYQFYCIQPKSFEIHQSFSYMGFNNHIPDSEYCFTMSHAYYPECAFDCSGFSSDSARNILLEKIKEIDPKYVLPIWEKVNINHREFVLSRSIDTLSSGLIMYSIGGSTCFNNYIINLSFTKRTRTYHSGQDFFKDAFEMMKTARLN